MKLPHHGCLYDPDTGKVVWMWSNGDPEKDFAVMPPIRRLPDGTLESAAQPHHQIIDLGDYTIEDMQELHRDHAAVRLREDATGKLQVKKAVRVGAEEVEIEHPVEHIKKLRMRT